MLQIPDTLIVNSDILVTLYYAITYPFLPGETLTQLIKPVILLQNKKLFESNLYASSTYKGNWSDHNIYYDVQV